MEDWLRLLRRRNHNITHNVEILTTLAGASVTLKINKGHLLQKQVQYLGHTAKPGQLEIDITNGASLRNAEPAKTETQLR